MKIPEESAVSQCSHQLPVSALRSLFLQIGNSPDRSRQPPDERDLQQKTNYSPEYSAADQK